MSIGKKLDILYIKVKNINTSMKRLILSREKKKLLLENKKWKNKYKGLRCFVVGNGPSLKEQDLSLLRDEYVFTVNQIMRSEVYSLLNSDFHIIADSLYFNMNSKNPDHKKIIQNLSKINYSNKKPECFFPITASDDISRLGLTDLNANYFFSGLRTYDDMKINFDMTKSIYGFHTVVQYAIEIAIYMGFKEIYLLGCDMTGYKEAEQFATMHFNENTHIYSETKEEMQSALHNKRTCEQWFGGIAKMFTDYRRLNDAVSKTNIKLTNLTVGGILDSLPREKYESVVWK